MDVCVSNCWSELLALPCFIDNIIELVNLLKGEALGLIDHCIHKDNRNGAEAAPDEEHLWSKISLAGAIICQVWRRVSDCPVKQPVRSSREGETLRSGLQWVQLSGYNPCNWTPSASKEEDIDADKGELGILSGCVAKTGGSSHDGNLFWKSE